MVWCTVYGTSFVADWYVCALDLLFVAVFTRDTDDVYDET